MPRGLKGFQKGHTGFRKKVTVKRQCAYCGNNIFVAPHLVKMGSGKFCNASCYAKWQSENRIGENSYNWCGGADDTYRARARKIIKKLNIPLVCSVCGRKESIIVHHKDLNIENNKLSNLKVLCQSCHVTLHNKISPPTKKYKQKHFICEICSKVFTDLPHKDRKVCSSACSYEYCVRGLHWRNREN